MKIYKYLIGATVVLGSLLSFSAHAVILGGNGGGTGIGNATSGNVGQVLTVSSSSPFLTYTFTTPSGNSSTLITGTNGVAVVQSGINATATLDTTYAAVWTALETFSKGLTANGTTTLGSTTNAIAVTNASGTVIAFAGSNPCSASQAAQSISATGTILCVSVVTSTTGNWTGTWQGTNSSTFYLASNPSGYVTSSIVNGYSTSTIVITTSTASNIFNVTSSGNKTFNITLPAQGSTLYTPSTTIPTTYVTSINGATGTYSVVAGTNITISTSSTSTIINSSGGGGSNNATGTVNQGAVFNATNTIVSNLIYYVPQTYATTGCAGDSSAAAKTWNGCVYAIYKSMASAGGGTIWQTFDVTSTWTSLLSFNINGDIVQLNCTAGTNLVYTGTSTPSADTWLPSGQNISLNFNFGNPIGHARTSENGNCDLRGNPSLIAAGNTNTVTSTGIYFGGTYSYTDNTLTATTTNAGAVGVNVDYNVNGFGRNLWYGANAYVDAFTGTSSGGNGGNVTGSLLFFDVANNSGERWVMQGGTYTDPGNSTTTNAIYLTNAGTASIFFNFNSADDAVIVCGASDGQCDVSANHIENAAYNTYGAYIPIQNPSSDRSTAINASFEEYANDATTASGKTWVTLIKHGAQLTAIGSHIDNYGGATITNYVDHSNDNGLESEMICMTQITTGGLTNLVAGGGNVTYSLQAGNGCIFDNANSFPLEWSVTSGSIIQLTSGNSVVQSVDHTGNTIIGIAGTSGSLKVQGNVNATGTITSSGNTNVGGALNVTSTATFQATTTAIGALLDGSGNAYVTSTAGGGGGVTTSTAGITNTLPIWTSSSALGNSVISQNGTTTTIAASTTNIGTATTTFQIFSNGHLNSSGTVASVSSCGTSPSIKGTDVAGTVTVGSISAASCTITFQNAYASKPTVILSSESAGIVNLAYTPSTSTIVITGTSLVGDVFDYFVIANQ